MSNLFNDPFPAYKQVLYPQQKAGLRKQTKDESSAICLQPPQRQISTPNEIKHYRKSFKEQAGTTILHYGHVNDQLPPPNFTYGAPTEKSENVEGTMKAARIEGINKFNNDILESKYKSIGWEPLGQSIDRKYNMPAQTNSQRFKYGLPTQKNRYDVKETIYSGENMPQKEQVRQMYLKSHQDYDPGEQKNREYNWNKVDPTDFRFGKVAKNIIHNEIKQVMAPDSNSSKFPETKLIKNNLNDYLDKKSVKLGQTSNLGQKQFPPGHAFGVRIQGNEWDAGKCLKGEGTEYDVREDDNLGRCTKIGSRNLPKEGDESRAFGVPTVRYDIKKPEKQSVADPNNYADQTTAIQLLFPKQFSSFGVGQQDFDFARPKQDIYEIFTNIGFQFKGNVFNAIFQRSKVIHGTILDKVSCNSFKKAIYQMCG